MAKKRQYSPRELACRVLELGHIEAVIERGIRSSDISDPALAKLWGRVVCDYAVLRPVLAETDIALRKPARKAIASLVVSQGGILSAIDHGLKVTDMPDPEMSNLWYATTRRYAIFCASRDNVQSVLNAAFV